jgi:hypothetical protein
MGPPLQQPSVHVAGVHVMPLSAVASLFESKAESLVEASLWFVASCNGASASTIEPSRPPSVVLPDNT